jgi:hypothetical protein
VAVQPLRPPELLPLGLAPPLRLAPRALPLAFPLPPRLRGPLRLAAALLVVRRDATTPGGLLGGALGEPPPDRPWIDAPLVALVPRGPEHGHAGGDVVVELVPGPAEDAAAPGLVHALGGPGFQCV